MVQGSNRFRTGSALNPSITTHVADEGEGDDLPEDHPEEEVPLEGPQEEENNEQGEPPLKDLDYPNNAIEGFGSEQPHYQWDKLNDEETPSF